ncbi:MAG: DegV family protein [Acidimicrobiales bacterium]
MNTPVPQPGPIVAVVTDSASMLPPAWRDRLRVAVAPMTVVMDGEAYREGVDLDGPEFYRRLAAGAEVSTSAPSPGALLAAYQAAADTGATTVVAVHTGSAYSGVGNAAGIAAAEVAIAVELIDTGTVSFPVALCVAAAGAARDSGGTAAEVADAARRTAAVVDSVFVVGVPELARRGGRFGEKAKTATTILGLGPSGVNEHGTAADIDEAIAQMAAIVRGAARGTALRVGVGDADRPDLGERLTDALSGAEGIADLVRYEVGPSVGAHTGPGTVGAVWAPA